MLQSVCCVVETNQKRTCISKQACFLETCFCFCFFIFWFFGFFVFMFFFLLLFLFEPSSWSWGTFFNFIMIFEGTLIDFLGGKVRVIALVSRKIFVYFC